MIDSNHLEKIVAQIEDKARRLPPIEQWSPEFSGDLDMRIAADGRWYYLGSEIKRHALVQLFSSILLKEGEDYFLITPVEKYRITVDKLPFIAVSAEKIALDDSGQAALLFTTNVGDQLIAGPEHPIRVEINLQTDEPTPIILVRRNLEALISRNVFYQLVDQADVEKGHSNELFVTSSGERFSLGRF